MSDSYICPVCGWTEETDTSRTHCPRCLCGVHTDDPEDPCGGRLEPVSVWVKEDGAWELIHRCSWCGEMEITPLAGDENPVKLLSIAAAPLGAPPFPIDKIEQLTALMGGQGDMGGYNHEA